MVAFRKCEIVRNLCLAILCSILFPILDALMVHFMINITLGVMVPIFCRYCGNYPANIVVAILTSLIRTCCGFSCRSFAFPSVFNFSFPCSITHLFQKISILGLKQACFSCVSCGSRGHETPVPSHNCWIVKSIRRRPGGNDHCLFQIRTSMSPYKVIKSIMTHLSGLNSCCHV
jgi:hypothetical protein